MSLLRIAVPNKGSLSQAASEILRESGYRQRDDAKQLTLIDDENGVEFFYLRPRDIALYVGEGTLDVGITGRDLLRDSGAKADEVLSLGFGRSRFRFAGPAGRFSDLEPARRDPHRHVVRRGGARLPRGARASRPRWSGSTGPSRPASSSAWPTWSPTSSRPAAPCAPPGSRSSARRCWSPRPCWSPARAAYRRGFEIFRRRVEGVLVARSYVMMDYDIAQADVDAAVALTPGIEGPTIAPLHREGWVAVRAMVPRDGAQRLMDELYEIGARGILLTDIHACRL